MYSSVRSTFLCIRDSWVSPSQVFIMFYFSNLWECMLQKPLAPTARISGDCNQTWSGSRKEIFNRLWQTRVV